MKKRYYVEFTITRGVMVDFDSEEFTEHDDHEEIAATAASKALDCEEGWSWTKVDPDKVEERDTACEVNFMHIEATNPYDDDYDPEFEYIK